MQTTCPIAPARRVVRIATPPRLLGWPIDSRSHQSLRRTRLTFLAVSAAFLLGACDGNKPASSLLGAAQPEMPMTGSAQPDLIQPGAAQAEIGSSASLDSSMGNPVKPAQNLPTPTMPQAMPEPEGPYSPIPNAAQPAPAGSGASPTTTE